ncbi:TPA: hypothetical protein ACH3X3_011924 [Trebouxia sp. C0006]
MHMVQLLAQLQAGSVDPLWCAGSIIDVQPGPTMHQTAPVASVTEGDTVIFDVNGEKQAFVTVKKTGKVKVGKQQCSLQPIIGQPYGSIYQVSADTSELVRFKRPRTSEWTSVEEVNKDNSELLDIGAASQQLSTDDIAALRASGKTGEEIVAALAEGSATFQGKTQFSQAKYKKKKQKKYTVSATIQRPTARSICEAYFGKSSPKINHLRVDSLAMLLSLANIGSHGKVLVLETCSGLVTGAVAERLGGFGHVCTTYLGDKCPPLEATRMLNFSDSIKQSMSTAPLAALFEYQAQATADESPATVNTARQAEELIEAQVDGQAEQPNEGQPERQLNGQPEQPRQHQQEAGSPIGLSLQHQQVAGMNGACMRGLLDANSEQPQPSVLTGLSCSLQPETGVAEAPIDRREQVRRMKEQREAQSAATQKLLKAVCKTGFDCCIVAAPSNHPTGVVKKLLPLLAPSASFAIFSNWQQPLAECHLALQQSKQALNLTLAESWWREYQVLPARTHPTMSTSGTGGYILSGTKISS